MKIVAVLRVKNEMPVIEECLAKLSLLVDEIVIVDNGSIDGTLEAYKKFNKVVQVIQTEGFDEGRDKILAHEAAKRRNPDWMLWTDGDEVFENHFTRKQIEKYMNSRYNKILFRMCNFWLDREHFRIDNKHFIYTLNPQRSMWRNIEGSYFSGRKINNGDIRNTGGKTYISPYRLKHYGYINKEKVRAKYNLYTTVNKEIEDPYTYYSHLDPDAKVIKIKFHEFKNYFVNLAYILIYKYVTDFIKLLIRLRRKIF